MTKATMPESTAWMLAYQTMGGDIGWKLSWSQSGAGICHRLAGEAHEKPLITTDQAEAYANARVREALEEAAGIIKANAEACDSGTRIMLRANAEAVLALIPSTPARPESEQ